MAWTQADLDALRANIASGIMVTRFADGREVRYQTTADMMAAEQRIASFVASQISSPAPRRRFPGYRSGA